MRELLVSFGISVDAGGFKKVEAGLGAITSAAKVAAGVVAGAAGALFGLAEGARRTIDDFHETAQSVGVTTGFLVDFSTAARLGGASMEDTAAATAKFARKIVEAREGNKDAIKSFEELGISQKDLNDLPTEALIAKLANGMRDIQDPQKRVALAFDLLGKGGRKLIPTLSLGADAMTKMVEEAGPLRQLIQDQEGPANDMEAALGGVRIQAEILRLTVGSKLMPIVTEIATRFAEWAKENRGLILSKVDTFVEGLKTVVEFAWDATVGFVGAMKDLVGWFKESPGAVTALKDVLAIFIGLLVASKVLVFVQALQGLRAIILAINIAIAANPIGLLLTLLAVAVSLWIANWDEIKEVTLFAWEAIKEAGRDALAFLSGIWTSIASTASEAWDGMKLAFTDTVTAFKQAFEGIATWFEKTVIDPMLAKWRTFTGTLGQIGEFIGIGPGGGGQSPGRPGSPESRIGLTPTVGSFGRGGIGGGGARTVQVNAPITIHAAPGMSAAEKDDIESRVRRAARQVFESEARQVLAEMP